MLLSFYFYVPLLSIFLNYPQTWWQHQEGYSWPGRRWYHIAACLGYGGQHQRLLISGGVCGFTTYDDMGTGSTVWKNGEGEDEFSVLANFVLKSR